MLNITKHVLIWTMATVIPFQGLPARSCGCTASHKATSTSPHCSHKDGASCCSARSAGHSYCSDALRQAKTSNCCGKAKCDCQHCRCGIYCPCQQGKQVPPTAPPVEQRSLDKVINLALAPVPVAAIVPSSESQRPVVTLASWDAMSGLDRCISLCRFTL